MQVFSCEFCKISQNTFFKHFWATASVNGFHLKLYACDFRNKQNPIRKNTDIRNIFTAISVSDLFPNTLSCLDTTLTLIIITFVIDFIQTPSSLIDLGNTSLDTAKEQFKKLRAGSKEYG